MVLGRGDVDAVTEHWLTTPVGLIEQEPCMQPLRAGVIGAGALILDETISRIPGKKIRISETDILDAIALGLLD